MVVDISMPLTSDAPPTAGAARGATPLIGGEVVEWLLAPWVIKDWQTYWFRS